MDVLILFFIFSYTFFFIQTSGHTGMNISLYAHACIIYFTSTSIHIHMRTITYSNSNHTDLRGT